MHQLDDAGEHVGIGVGQHAVHEVDDVPGCGGPFGKDLADPPLDRRPRREEQRRVEIALHLSLIHI